MGITRRPLVLKEFEIAQTCSDMLQHDGWRMIITDPVSDKSRGKGFGELGMADRLYIRYQTERRIPFHCEVMWIEWKRIDQRGRTTTASQHQLDWIRDERARGALVLLAGVDFPATIDGFIAWYKGSGLARKR